MALCQKCGQEIPDEETLCASCAGETAAADPVFPEEGQPAAQPPHFAPDLPPVCAVPPVEPPAYPRRPLLLTGESVPPEYKPLGAWSYFLYTLLFALPLVGFVCLLVFSCGGTRNRNLRNYARSYFCGLLVAVIAAALFTVLALTFDAGLLETLFTRVLALLPH